MLLLLALSLISVAPMKILILGDSLTAGYGLREEQAYPALLQKKFENKSLSIRVLNGGVSGDTTAGGLRRLPWMLRKSSPDFLVIALGGNDLLRGLPPHNTKENIKKMIAEARKLKVPVAILGIQAPGNLGARYARDFDRAFEELQREEQVPMMKNYIRSIAGDISMNLTDRIHPNLKGQEKLADEIFEFLYPLVLKIQGGMN